MPRRRCHQITADKPLERFRFGLSRASCSAPPLPAESQSFTPCLPQVVSLRSAFPALRFGQNDGFWVGRFAPHHALLGAAIGGGSNRDCSRALNASAKVPSNHR